VRVNQDFLDLLSAFNAAEVRWAVAFWRAVGYADDARIARYVRNFGSTEGQNCGRSLVPPSVPQ
jgi:hypothetical protein